MRKETTPRIQETKPREVETLEFLPVRFSNAERLDLAEQLARAAQSRQDAEDQKKAKDAEHKDTLEGLNLSIKRLTRKLTTGSEMRNVPCKWLLEDPTANEKTLVRLDTGEVVRVVQMQDHDRQLAIDSEIAAAAPAGEVLVLEPSPANGSAQ